MDLSTTNTRSQKQTEEFISFKSRKLVNIENWIFYNGRIESRPGEEVFRNVRITVE